VVLSLPVLASSLIVAVVVWNGALITFASMGDTVNTYTQRGATVTDSPMKLAWTDSVRVAAGSYTVTVTFAGGNPTDGILFVNEYPASSAAFDATAAFQSGFGTTGDPVTSAITPASNNELVVCAAGVFTTPTSLAAGAGFGHLLDAQGASVIAGAIEDLTQTTATAIAAPGFSTAVAAKWVAGCAAYAITVPVAAAGGQLTTLGAG
jgi:hypothetical protein